MGNSQNGAGISENYLGILPIMFGNLRMEFYQRKKRIMGLGLFSHCFVVPVKIYASKSSKSMLSQYYSRNQINYPICIGIWGEHFREFFGNNTEVLRELGNGIILRPKKNYGPRGLHYLVFCHDYRHLSHLHMGYKTCSEDPPPHTLTTT